MNVQNGEVIAYFLTKPWTLTWTNIFIRKRNLLDLFIYNVFGRFNWRPQGLKYFFNYYS